MREIESSSQGAEMEEDVMQNFRSKAAEFLLREEYKDAIEAYSQLIRLCQDRVSKKFYDATQEARLQKTLCLAFSSRADARFRLAEVAAALSDCDEALRIEGAHFKALLCKGRILLGLNRYRMASECFEAAILGNENADLVNGLLERCRKLEFLSKTGAFDVSDWVSGGFSGKFPDFAEYVGPVEIKKSEISGRGLFAAKAVEIGTLLFVTKAVAVERAILDPESGENAAQYVIWKNFIDQVAELASNCGGAGGLLPLLSTGEDEETAEVPDIARFRPDSDPSGEISAERLDRERLLSILDVNSILENAISSKVLGRNSDYQGVGLWILASFINHSCDPNVRRVHVGDHVIVHASREVKAGEELTFAYFDVLLPMGNRSDLARNWGFVCKCKRCIFEEKMGCNQEMKEMGMVLGKGLVDEGNLVYRLEESMRRWMVRGKGKGYLRASFWEAYCKLFGCEKMMKKWGRRVPSVEVVVDSVVDSVGSDERVVKVLVEGMKGGGIIGGVVLMEKGMKYGRGVYGKVVKKQAMRSLLGLGF